MTVLTESFTLANGNTIPKIGFGTWQIPNGTEAYDSVAAALSAGYRHIDTARAYGNEASVAEAIRDSGIPREEIYLTTKLPAEVKDYEGAKASFETTMDALGVDYIDLYLIHAPWPWAQRAPITPPATRRRGARWRRSSRAGARRRSASRTSA